MNGASVQSLRSFHFCLSGVMSRCWPANPLGGLTKLLISSSKSAPLIFYVNLASRHPLSFSVDDFMFWPRRPALCLTSPTLPLIHRNYLWVCQVTVCRYVTVWCSTVHHHPWVLTVDYEMFDLLYQMPLLTVGKPPSVAQMLESTEGFICFGSISFWDEFKKQQQPGF